MNTAFLLMAQYAQVIIPLDQVCRDHFAPLTLLTLLRKLTEGEIALPVTRMEATQKGMCGVHLADLAAYIDLKREAGQRELKAAIGRWAKIWSGERQFGRLRCCIHVAWIFRDAIEMPGNAWKYSATRLRHAPASAKCFQRHNYLILREKVWCPGPGNGKCENSMD